MRNKTKVGGILQYMGLSLLGVITGPDRPGLAAAVFRKLGENRLNAQFIVQSVDVEERAHIQFCVSRADANRALEMLRPLAATLTTAIVIERPNVSMFAVYGPDFRERPGIAGEMFEALAAANTNILAISTSISTVSCIIEESQADAARKALEEVFALP